MIKKMLNNFEIRIEPSAIDEMATSFVNYRFVIKNYYDTKKHFEITKVSELDKLFYLCDLFPLSQLGADVRERYFAICLRKYGINIFDLPMWRVFLVLSDLQTLGAEESVYLNSIDFTIKNLYSKKKIKSIDDEIKSRRDIIKEKMK